MPTTITHAASLVDHNSEAFRYLGSGIARKHFEPEHDAFRDSVRQFLEAEIRPHEEDWYQNKLVDKWAFKLAAEHGYAGIAVPEEFGGIGINDFRFNQIVLEECVRTRCSSFVVGIGTHTDVCLPYLMDDTTTEQKQRWLPGVADGTSIVAIAMTEPGTGSDLQSIATTAIRDGDEYVINGSKTFITNGINCTHVIVAAKTDPSLGARGTSLIMVEAGTPGFERGRKLEKLGLHGQDTAELFFTDCRVPVENLIGPEGTGFGQMMHKLPQERLNIAVNAAANTEVAIGLAVDYVRERKAFGKPIGSFQNTRFKLAELKTEALLMRIFVDQAVAKHVRGELSTDEAAMAKYKTTEVQNRVLDECLQLFGGYGYMTEYPIARMWADGRVTKIYAGTNEIMKEIIGRSMQLEG